MSTLIAYFSRSEENYFLGDVISLEEGNTEIIAKKIAMLTGGELFRIQPVVPYSSDYNICVEETKADKAKNARPEIANCITSIDEYDTIYIGYPNFWGSLPMCVFTFIEKFDFTGKTIRPFCTHEGSGFGNTIEELRTTCEGAKVEKGLEILGSSVGSHDEAVRNWINKKLK